MASSRYPKNWNEIAYQVKESAQWRCAKCGMQCLRPGDDVSGMSKSERMRRTLTVHHLNYQPEDSRLENLIVTVNLDKLLLFRGLRLVVKKKRSPRLAVLNNRI